MKHGDWVISAEFNPDGQRVLTASRDRTSRLWDAATGKAIGEPMRYNGDLFFAQFISDGKRIVTASQDNTTRLWDAATAKPIGDPMKYGDDVTWKQFSPDGQRVVTGSFDNAARIWDAPTITNQDTPDDASLLADLAEATGGLALQAYGQTDILSELTPDQVKAIRDKIAVKFVGPSPKLNPLQRFLKWSVSDPRTRTISPFSDLTVADWVQDRIKEDTFESLQQAIQVDPTNARLIARFGLALANVAAVKKADPADARQALAEADYQTSRALKLDPE